MKKLSILLLFLGTFKISALPCYAPRITNVQQCNNSIQVDFDPFYSFKDSICYLEVSLDGNWSSLGSIVKDTIVRTRLLNQRSVKFYDLPIGTVYYFRMSFLGGYQSCAAGLGRYYFHPTDANLYVYGYWQNTYKPLINVIVSDYKCDSIKVTWNSTTDGLYNLWISDNSLYAGGNTLIITNITDTSRCVKILPGSYRYIKVESIGPCGVTTISKTYLKPGINYSVSAGIDIIKSYDTSLNLSGSNAPSPAIKRWRILSNSSTFFLQDSTSNNSFFRGRRGATYVLEYRVKSGLCEKKDTVKISFFICGDTIIDIRDGNKYPTTLISKVCWTAKNLNFGTFTTTANPQGSSGTVFKYCLDNLPGNCDTLGGLYQWDNARRGAPVYAFTQGVCPIGWHVSSETEAQNSIITAYNGNQYRVGGISGFEWKCIPNWDANLLMFTNSDCGNIYTTSIWWIHMTYNNGAGWYNGNPNHAFPMRCVKDNY